MTKEGRDKDGKMKKYHQKAIAEELATEVVTEVGQSGHNQVERCKKSKPKAKKKREIGWSIQMVMEEIPEKDEIKGKCHAQHAVTPKIIMDTSQTFSLFKEA